MYVLLIGAAFVERDRQNILSVTFQTLSVSRFPDGHMKYIRWIYETFHLECELTLFSPCIEQTDMTHALLQST